MFNPYNPYGSGNPPAPNYNIPAPTFNTNLIYVNGLEDVKSRYVMPGNTVLFVDNDKPLLYKKSSDNQGHTTIDVFTISPYTAELKGREYVTQEMFNEVKTRLDGLEKLLKENKGVQNGNTEQ